MARRLLTALEEKAMSDEVVNESKLVEVNDNLEPSDEPVKATPVVGNSFPSMTIAAFFSRIRLTMAPFGVLPFFDWLRQGPSNAQCV